MPSYEYLCGDCGVKFEVFLVASKRTNERDCKFCEGTAKQELPTGVSSGFNVAPTNSVAPAPQNTGVSSFDYDCDRIIAQDAKRKWETVDQRDSVKREVLRANPGAKSSDLRKVGDGNYEVIGSGEMKEIRKMRAEGEYAQMAGTRQGS